MPRFLMLLTIATTAFSGVALAATPSSGTFKAGRGKIESGYDLKFKVSKGKIKDLAAHVLEYCDGSSTSQIATVGPDLTWKIKKGKFKGRKKETAHGVTVYTTLKGRFTSASTAKGKLRQETIVAGSVCDTYELDFTATK
jgi:hypothetical protein